MGEQENSRLRPDSPHRSRPHLVVDVIEDDGFSGWAIISQGIPVSAGVVEGSKSQAILTAVRELLQLKSFPGTPTYICHRDSRMVLNKIYPNIIRNGEQVPERDLKMAHRHAIESVRHLKTQHRRLERKRHQRREETRRRKFKSNRRLPRLAIALYACPSRGSDVMGAAWLAEDGRHGIQTVHAASVCEAELVMLQNVLGSINSGRLLLVGTTSARTIDLLRDRKRIITSTTATHSLTLVEVLKRLDRASGNRDIMLCHFKETAHPLVSTAAELAEFAHDFSSNNSDGQWCKVDNILWRGIGFDRTKGTHRKV